MRARPLMVSALLLLLLLPLMCRQASAQPAADQELGLGGWSFRVSTGYSGFGLPVSNWALGRQWASEGSLAWQMAYNYSAVPVLVELEHREAQAFYGRIEVVADHGYSAEEAQTQEPVLYSREIVAPPSVPQSFAFQVRSAPPSEIGGYVRFKVRLYRKDKPEPLMQQSPPYRQLEPGWIYGLYLDDPLWGEEDGVYIDKLNEAGRLGLQVPGVENSYFDETRLYTIPVRRQQLTAAPLAARNFAFAFADARAVALWPADEQQALQQYLLGGGYLCLFNAGGEWQGLSIDGEPRFVGRGLLLPCSGDFSSARTLARRWLEGELEELALYCGGQVRGQRIRVQRSGDGLSADLRLDALFDAPDGEDALPSHEADYLHPIWLYRESMHNAALEPWDNPEFSLGTGTAGGRPANPLLSRALPNQPVQPSLAAYTARERRIPAGLPALAALLVLAFACMPLRRRGKGLQALALLLFCIAGSALLFSQRPRVSQPLRLELHDREQGLPQSVTRLLLAGVADRSGNIEFSLGKSDLLRRVSWDQPGQWSLREEDDKLLWRGSGGASFLSLAADSLPEESAQAPVSVSVRREDSGMLQVEADATALPQGAMCCLLLPLGWTYFEGGSVARVYTESPPQQVWPGYARLAAWQEFTERWRRRATRDRTPSDDQNESLLRSLLGSRAGQQGRPELTRLGMSGIVQDPLGFRGMQAARGQLFIELPGELDGAESAVSARFMRLSFSLEPGP